MSTLVNMAVHELTDEQKQMAKKELGVVYFMAYEDLYPELFKQISNLPSNSVELECLAVQVINSIHTILLMESDKDIYFHLPFDSPGFIFALSKWMCFATQKNGKDIYKGKILFSHSQKMPYKITLAEGSVYKGENIFKFIKF